MRAQISGSSRSEDGALARAMSPWVARPVSTRGHILIVEDEEIIRESMAPLLEDAGYEVSLAENGRDALRRLNGGPLPDLIVLDLRMPVMDGWQFRILQKDDPRLGRVPVIAISADGSAHAAAISAQAYLRKPVGAKHLLATIAKVLLEDTQQKAARQTETERLAALGRLAAGVGHEINNPLTFVLLNLTQSLEKLRAPVSAEARGTLRPALPEVELAELRAQVALVTEMLEDCKVGADRIRATVSNLQRLSRADEEPRGIVDIQKVIEQSVSMSWNHIRHRARLVKKFANLPSIRGNGAALGQVFLDLLMNAAESIPEGNAQGSEIEIVTREEPGEDGSVLVVEISDTGTGIAPDVIGHVFEPFFTTKPMGQGTGLGLSVSRQTVLDHGGRMTVESQPGRRTVFRVFLPVGDATGTEGTQAEHVMVVPTRLQPAVVPRGRVLVIDDEPLIGRVIRNSLKPDHDVIVVERASDAVVRLENGEMFDIVLCDVVMPDLSGPEFYRMVADRWPDLVPRLVFMTGGAFTPSTAEFMERVATRVLSKPFKVDSLKRLVRERIRGNA